MQGASLVPRPPLAAFFRNCGEKTPRLRKKSCEGRPGYEATTWAITRNCTCTWSGKGGKLCAEPSAPKPSDKQHSKSLHFLYQEQINLRAGKHFYALLNTCIIWLNLLYFRLRKLEQRLPYYFITAVKCLQCHGVHVNIHSWQKKSDCEKKMRNNNIIMDS